MHIVSEVSEVSDSIEACNAEGKKNNLNHTIKGSVLDSSDIWEILSFRNSLKKTSYSDIFNELVYYAGHKKAIKLCR